jgi:hypothetical protein
LIAPNSCIALDVSKANRIYVRRCISVGVATALTMSAAEREEAWLLVPDSKALFAMLAAVWATYRTREIELAELAPNESFELRKAKMLLRVGVVVCRHHLRTCCSRLH